MIVLDQAKVFEIIDARIKSTKEQCETFMWMHLEAHNKKERRHNLAQARQLLSAITIMAHVRHDIEHNESLRAPAPLAQAH